MNSKKVVWLTFLCLAEILVQVKQIVAVQCGDRLIGSTNGIETFIGDSAGDALFIFSLDSPGPYEILLDGCASDYDTWIYVAEIFNSSSRTGGGVHLGDIICECDDCGECGTRTSLTCELPVKGDYAFLIGGYGDSEGNYDVEFTCRGNDECVTQPPNWLDKYNRDCDYYELQGFCHEPEYVDSIQSSSDDFGVDAFRACCTCDGGSSTDCDDIVEAFPDTDCEIFNDHPERCHYTDDASLDARYKCCACGGGEKKTRGDYNQCPKNPSKTEKGICGCNMLDVDDDNDGVVDCREPRACRNNPRVTNHPCESVRCPSDCVEDSRNRRGCNDPLVEECVCSIDNVCCDSMWDYICVAVAKGHCGCDN